MPESIVWWIWASVGIVLFIAEAIGFTGFLLGLGVAALVCSAVFYIFQDLFWAYQFSLFSALGVALSIAYYQRFRAFNSETDRPMLNDRVSQLVGARAKLLHPVVTGTSKIQVGDTIWKVRCAEEAKEGEEVVVVAVDGLTLIVTRLATH